MQVRDLKSLAKKKVPAKRIAKTLKRTEGATRQKAFSHRIVTRLARVTSRARFSYLPNKPRHSPARGFSFLSAARIEFVSRHQGGLSFRHRWAGSARRYRSLRSFVICKRRMIFWEGLMNASFARAVICSLTIAGSVVPLRKTYGREQYYALRFMQCRRSHSAPRISCSAKKMASPR